MVDSAEVSRLVTLANDLVVESKGSDLSDAQKDVLRQALSGKKLENITVKDYSPSYSQRGIAQELWKLLSDVLKENVGIKNVRSVLKKLACSHYSALGLEKTASPIPSTLHNLLVPDHTDFIGRLQEITRLLELLSFNQATRLINVKGIGGVGKTTLVLEAAYRLTKKSYLTPTFDAIIFTSAQLQVLTGNGILQLIKQKRTLRDILRAIALTLNCPDISIADLEEQVERIQELLGRQRTLLIVDNLETIAEQNDILAFLYDLPPTVKAVVTTRDRVPLGVTIDLEPFPKKDGIDLIQHQAEEKGVTLSPKDSQELYQKTSGIPAAIVYAIGQLASGYLIQDVLTRLTLASSEVARFCFDGSVTPLRGQPSHRLLMALTLFPKSAQLEALVQVALPEADISTTSEGLARLQQLSLVKQHQGRYQMIPLTRGYVLAELEAHPDFEQEARERWLRWYWQYSQQHGTKDWKEWNEYGQLEQEWENLQAAIEWCIASDRYTDFLEFWRHVKCYSYDRGYNSDRLTYWHLHLDWIDWLIQAAQNHQDLPTAAEAMRDRGWMSTLMGKPEQLEAAEALLARAWELRDYKDQTFQIDLAINIAVVRIHQQQFDRAHDWLKLAQSLLEPAQIEEKTAKRLWIHLLYYQGEICFKTGDYHQAKSYYQETLLKAQAIGWKRAVYCAQNWLADIAIEQRNLDEAKRLLSEGLQVAKSNKDKCHAAFCQQSMAFLEKAHGNLTEACYWAELAYKSFLGLGMFPEAEETSSLLQGCAKPMQI